MSTREVKIPEGLAQSLAALAAEAGIDVDAEGIQRSIEATPESWGQQVDKGFDSLRHLVQDGFGEGQGYNVERFIQTLGSMLYGISQERNDPASITDATVISLLTTIVSGASPLLIFSGIAALEMNLKTEREARNATQTPETPASETPA